MLHSIHKICASAVLKMFRNAISMQDGDMMGTTSADLQVFSQTLTCPINHQEDRTDCRCVPKYDHLKRSTTAILITRHDLDPSVTFVPLSLTTSSTAKLPLSTGVSIHAQPLATINWRMG
jgi:hypothetical protein